MYSIYDIYIYMWSHFGITHFDRGIQRMTFNARSREEPQMNK